jgi:hypothetical protein
MRRPKGGWMTAEIVRSAGNQGNAEAYKHFNAEIAKAKVVDAQGFGRVVMWARQAHAGVAMREAVKAMKKSFAGGYEDRVPVYAAGTL